MNISGICPVCGVIDWIPVEDVWHIEEPYSKPYALVTESLTCNNCSTGFEGDDNDPTIKKAGVEAKKIAMAQIIADLQEMGNSKEEMEGILRLPEGTLSRWKNDQNSYLSAEVYVLMQIIRTFPWILDVVVHKFSREYAEGIMVRETVDSVLSENGFFVRLDKRIQQASEDTIALHESGPEED